jgi:hypothetical protein
MQPADMGSPVAFRTAPESWDRERDIGSPARREELANREVVVDWQLLGVRLLTTECPCLDVVGDADVPPCREYYLG